MYGSVYGDPDIGIHTGIFENHLCAFGEGCPCSGHVYVDPDMGIHTGIFENHVCAFGEGCPCSGHMYGSAYRYPDMGIHRGAFLRTTYVRLERGVLAGAYVWKRI